MHSRFAAAGGALVFCAVAVLAQGASQSFSGTVSDAMCGGHHMMANATAADCTRACVKKGSDYALVVGSKVYTLKGDKAQLDKFAGEKVTVMGAASGNTITVKSIAPAKS
jgi:hypothetical protein